MGVDNMGDLEPYNLKTLNLLICQWSSFLKDQAVLMYLVNNQTLSSMLILVAGLGGDIGVLFLLVLRVHHACAEVNVEFFHGIGYGRGILGFSLREFLDEAKVGA